MGKVLPVCIYCACLWLNAWSCSAQLAHPTSSLRSYQGDGDAEPAFVSQQVLLVRDFPLLDAIENDAKVQTIIAEDPDLIRLGASKWDLIAKAVACKGELSCDFSRILWSDREIALTKAALIRLWGEHLELKMLVERSLVASGKFRLSPTGNGGETLALAWQATADAMNHIIRVYGLGEAPRYPLPDSISFDPKSHDYGLMVQYLMDHLAVNMGSQENTLPSLFFEPDARISLRLLDLNGRDEAGRLYPLSTGANLLTIQRSKAVKWTLYPYVAIVVPGASSPLSGVPLGLAAQLRCEMAAQHYRKHQAPFIMVSGGFVHPARTPYSEAIEMKRYLHEVLGVPSDAIFIDPYARHTTTNLRNVSREVFEYGLPITKPLLLVTDQAQSENVGGPAFKSRCLDELGYMPIVIGKRLTSTDLEFLPSRQSLLVDAFNDPLDP